MTRRLLGACVLAVLPVLVTVGALQVRDAEGPYWLSRNLDPTYAYLENSLAVANLHRPYHVDHPGTPAQVLGGITIRVLHPFSSEQDMAREVLRDPEAHLRTINGLLIVLYGAGLLVAGYVAFLVTRSLLAGMLMQTAALASQTLTLGLTGFRPEPLLALLGLLVGAVALLALRWDVRAHERAYAVAFGVLVGVGVASKVNFAPLAVIPLVLLPGWRARGQFAMTAAVAFAVAIAPIVTQSRLDRFADFLSGVSTHTGLYGTGSTGVVDPDAYGNSVVDLVETDWPFFTVAGIAAIAAVALLLSRRRSSAPQSGPALRLLVAIPATAVLQLVLVAKHPASHYLLPALALFGTIPVVGVALARQRWAETPAWTRRGAFAIGAIALVAIQLVRLNDADQRASRAAAEQRAAVRKIATDYPGVPVATYYSASSRPYALSFGAVFSEQRYASVLEELYPGELFYDPPTGGFRSFVGPLDLRRVVGDRGRLLLHGWSLNDADLPRSARLGERIPDALAVRPVFRGGADRPGVYDGEAIYEAELRR